MRDLVDRMRTMHPSFSKLIRLNVPEDGGLVEIHWTEPGRGRVTVKLAASRRGLKYVQRAMEHLYKIEAEESQ